MGWRRCTFLLVVAGLLVTGCTATGPAHKVGSPGNPPHTKAQPVVTVGGPPSNVFADVCTVLAGHSSSPACTRGAKVIDALWARPLHLPQLSPGQSCPTTPGRRYSNRQFGGVALGTYAVRPLIAQVGAAALHGRPLVMRRDGWWAFKTLWFAMPRYSGPFLVRGANLVTGAPVRFGDVPPVIALAVRAQTVNGDYGFREAPGGTYVKRPGCYGWQIDAVGFSRVIVFQAHR
jgi:hypothetical protein